MKYRIAIKPDATPEQLRHWVREFQRMRAARQVIPIQLGNPGDEPSSKYTVGQVARLAIGADGESLVIEFLLLTEAARKLIDTDKVQFSPMVLTEWGDGAGNEYENAIVYFSMTSKGKKEMTQKQELARLSSTVEQASRYTKYLMRHQLNELCEQGRCTPQERDYYSDQVSALRMSLDGKNEVSEFIESRRVSSSLLSAKQQDAIAERHLQRLGLSQQTRVQRLSMMLAEQTDTSHSLYHSDPDWREMIDSLVPINDETIAELQELYADDHAVAMKVLAELEMAGHIDERQGKWLFNKIKPTRSDSEPVVQDPQIHVN